MMLAPFFSLAAVSPGRQRVFRQAVVAHLVVMAGAVWAMQYRDQDGAAPFLGYVLLVAGIIEGAVLLGWRLTQLPKSQALEFLLVTPLRPGRLFLMEALVGIVQLTLVTLSGLPVLILVSIEGYLGPLDLIPLLLIPLSWGAVAGFGLTVWAYEAIWIRRLGEKVAMALILGYLIVGVLAGENLRAWLGVLPDELAGLLLHAF